MSPATFVKRYRSRAEVDTALAHYHWLVRLGASVEFPRVLGRTPTTVTFEHVPGRRAERDDLPAVAGALGRLHRAVRSGLPRTTVNSQHTTISGTAIEGFAGPRRQRLHVLLQQERKPDSPLSHEAVDLWLDQAASLPVAVYKDTNPRNLLVGERRDPVMVDFDSLTLAPVGYDLAKLLVTTAMTAGTLPRSTVEDAFSVYLEELALGSTACPLAQLLVWAEFHHLLTHPYLGRHGYHHEWPAVRPWPIDEVHRALAAPATGVDRCPSAPR